MTLSQRLSSIKAFLCNIFVLLRLRVLLFGEIKRYKSPIRIRIRNRTVIFGRDIG